ncbi:MAG: hypothetical protein LBK07_04120 [Tannerella sp.]|nr:hypothetical protein [Tannerella sp.]
MRHAAGYLLVFFGCLLLPFALPSAGGGEEGAAPDAAATRAAGREGTVMPVHPLRPDLIRAAETAPLTCMYRITNSLRSFVRIPARNIHHSISFEKVILLYSVHKKSLSRIFIRKHAFNTFLCPHSPCRYYVFALREILL